MEQAGNRADSVLRLSIEKPCYSSYPQMDSCMSALLPSFIYSASVNRLALNLISKLGLPHHFLQHKKILARLNFSRAKRGESVITSTSGTVILLLPKKEVSHEYAKRPGSTSLY